MHPSMNLVFSPKSKSPSEVTAPDISIIPVRILSTKGSVLGKMIRMTFWIIPHKTEKKMTKLVIFSIDEPAREMQSQISVPTGKSVLFLMWAGGECENSPFAPCEVMRANIMARAH